MENQVAHLRPWEQLPSPESPLLLSFLLWTVCSFLLMLHSNQSIKYLQGAGHQGQYFTPTRQGTYQRPPRAVSTTISRTMRSRWPPHTLASHQASGKMSALLPNMESYQTGKKHKGCVGFYYLWCCLKRREDLKFSSAKTCRMVIYRVVI